MLKKLISLSLILWAMNTYAQPAPCQLTNRWLGPVANEVLKKNPNSPGYIKEIVNAFGARDKGVSYDRLANSYECKLIRIGEMGLISFENSAHGILMIAHGGAEKMGVGPSTCFRVSLLDKATDQAKVTDASLIVEKAIPMPRPINQCGG